MILRVMGFMTLQSLTVRHTGFVEGHVISIWFGWFRLDRPISRVCHSAFRPFFKSTKNKNNRDNGVNGLHAWI